MCIESYEEGKAFGYSEGREVGYEEGHKHGYDEGFDDGHEEGFDEGQGSAIVEIKDSMREDLGKFFNFVESIYKKEIENSPTFMYKFLDVLDRISDGKIGLTDKNEKVYIQIAHDHKDSRIE